MVDMAATLLLLHQLGRSRRNTDDRAQGVDFVARESLANTPLCSENSACIKRFPCCAKFTCSTLVYLFIGFAAAVLLCVSVTSTITTRYVDFDKRSILLSPGDSRQIQDGFSYTFCKSVRLTSDISSTFSAYLLEDEPEISDVPNKYVQTELINLKEGQYFHWRAHLLQLSSLTIETVTLSQCDGLTLYVAKERYLNTLLSSEQCTSADCIIENTSPCLTAIELDVDQSSDYVFVYKNSLSLDIDVFVNITWHRTTYKLQNVGNECHSARCYGHVCPKAECILAVPESTHLIITVPHTKNSSFLDDNDVELTCDPQILSYIIMFATVPLVGFAILLPMGFIIIHIARRISPVKQSQRHTCRSQDAVRRVSTGLGAGIAEPLPIEIRLCPPPYDGHRPPPSYETVIPTTHSREQGSTTIEVEQHEEDKDEELPKNPPSYSESGRDFVVALATPT